MGREHCEICGKPALPGRSYELLSGWLCSDCAEGLSPWFQEFDMAEPEEIRSQLQLRKENQKKLRSFHPTRRFGDDTMVVVDDDAQTFVVTDSFQLKQTNPDIFTLEQVLDCSVEVEEERSELEDGMYLYSYQLFLKIDLDHEYLDDIRFPLNEEVLEFESSEKSFLGFGGFDPEEEEDYQYYAELGDLICDVLLQNEEEPTPEEYDVQPGEFDGEGPLIPESAGEDGPREVICPWCGCRTRVTEDYHCQNCGGNL